MTRRILHSTDQSPGLEIRLSGSGGKKRSGDPEAQELLLKLLEPLVRKVPWDAPLQNEWRKEVTDEVGEVSPRIRF